MDSLLLMQNHGHLELTNEVLQEKFERITGGHDRVRERFFNGKRPKSATSLPTSSAKPPPRRKVPKSNMVNYEMVDGRQVATKLKAPQRQTYQTNVQKDESNQPIAKWPVELELRNPPPIHNQNAPTEPEPFYFAPKQSPTRPAAKATTVTGGPGFGSTAARMTMGGVGEDRSPRRSPRAEARAKQHKTIGQVMYTRGSEGHKWFVPGATRTYTEDAPKLEPSYVPEDDNDIALVFDSRFESGNLEEAKRIGEYEYDLKLQNDLYTSRHTQWFYFSISNCKKGSVYKFNITNLLKPDSLYNHGMQPCVYSDAAAARDGAGWRRRGKNVRYARTKRRVDSVKIERQRYTLTWDFTCTEDNDTMYFAHCYPYTYTDLQNYLTGIAQDPARSEVCRQRVLCRSLCGNVCDLLTVTRFGCSSEEMAARKGIIVTSRVHPGESNASWMMKGFIDFITSEEPDAVTLRNHFIFKIVPMLNPDGVISGNYRTGLAGVDLNRVYKMPIRELYPTVYHVKSMMKRFTQDREVVLYADLHGHSRKHNVFAYGCDSSLRGGEKMEERVFIKMLELNGPSHFSLKDSRFHVKKAKDSTGRVNTWKELDLMNTFTIEATFCGSTIGPLANMQYSHKNFEDVGAIICDSIMDYWDPDSSKKAMILSQLADKYKEKGEDDGAGSSDEAEDSPGSDSTSSEGAGDAATDHFKTTMGVPFTYQLNVGQPRKKDLKTRKQLEKSRGKRVAKTNRRKKGVSRLAKPKVVRDEPRVSSAPSKRAGKGGKADKFVSRYDGRSNNGVPSFSEEQANVRQTKMAQQQSRQSTYRYDINQGAEASAGSRRHGTPFDGTEEPTLAAAFDDAIHSAMGSSSTQVEAEASESQDLDNGGGMHGGVAEMYGRVGGMHGDSNDSHLEQSVAEAQLIRRTTFRPQLSTGGNERLLQQLMDSDNLQSSDAESGNQGQQQQQQPDQGANANTDLVMSTLDMLRHKVHHEFVREQSSFSQRAAQSADPSWEYTEEPPQTQLNMVTPLFNPEGHSGRSGGGGGNFSATIGSPRTQRKLAEQRQQPLGSPHGSRSSSAPQRPMAQEGGDGDSGGGGASLIIPNFSPRAGPAPRSGNGRSASHRVWRKSASTAKGKGKAPAPPPPPPPLPPAADEGSDIASVELAAVDAAMAGERPVGRGSPFVTTAVADEAPPFPAANAGLVNDDASGGGGGGDVQQEQVENHFPQRQVERPPLTAEAAAAAAEAAIVAGRTPSPVPPMSAMERLAAAMQSKRAKVARVRATSPIHDLEGGAAAAAVRPRSRTSSVDHSAEPLTPRPGSAGNPLEPLSFRRCVCDAQVRHEVRELRGQFGGHMIRCKVCQGFAPENRSRPWQPKAARPQSRAGARPTTSNGKGRPLSRREIVRPKTRPASIHPSMP